MVSMKGIYVKKFFSFILCLFFICPVKAEQKNIMMVLWDGCEDACRGFQDYVASNNMDVKISVIDVKKNPQLINSAIDKVHQTRPDLLVTWGTMVSVKMLGTEQQALQEGYSIIVPSVFMVVSQPTESGLVSSLVSQGRNLTGVSQMPSISEQIQAAKQFFPFKKMGIIYNSSEKNSADVVKDIKNYASLLDYEVIDKPLPLDKEGKVEPKAIAGLAYELAEQKIDIFFLPPDFTMNENRDLLYQTAVSLGIPIFSASEGAVRHGNALFTYTHKYYNIGQMAGYKAKQILVDGIPAYNIPIETPIRGIFVVNMDVAKQFNVYPPLSLLPISELIN